MVHNGIRLGYHIHIITTIHVYKYIGISTVRYFEYIKGRN